jgi:hypothetical protein
MGVAVRGYSGKKKALGVVNSGDLSASFTSCLVEEILKIYIYGGSNR